MILETLRMWTDWQGNPTYGVNAQLATVPLDGTDARPTTLVAISDETRNGPTARRRVPDTVPVLMSRLHQAATLDPSVGPNTAIRDAEIQIATWYADNQLATETGNSNAYYVLRALERTLAKFLDPSIAIANTARKRGNIEIFGATTLEHLTTFETVEDSDILGGLLVTFKVRDSAP
jgi:predicted DNA-binding protein